jgi:hypothetical protein
VSLEMLGNWGRDPHIKGFHSPPSGKQDWEAWSFPQMGLSGLFPQTGYSRTQLCSYLDMDIYDYVCVQVLKKIPVKSPLFHRTQAPEAACPSSHGQ